MRKRYLQQCFSVAISAMVSSCKKSGWRNLNLLLAMSAAAVCSAWAAGPVYTYQVVAKTGDVIGGITLSSISGSAFANDETVLFVGNSPAGSTGALFAVNFATGARSILVRQGESIGGKVLGPIGSVSRNDGGELIFSAEVANNDNGYGLFSLAAPLVLPGQTISGLPIHLQSFALNNAGEVVFASLLSSPPFSSSSSLFTPGKVVYTTGSKVGGYSLTNPADPVLSSGGVLAFSAAFTSGAQTGAGIFTQNGLVVKIGDVVGGHKLLQLIPPAISKLGVIGYEGQYQPDPTFFAFAGAFYIDHSVIAQQGDVIDGVTLTTDGNDPLAPFGDSLSVNAGGEAFFSSPANYANGNQTGGFFTAKHPVLLDFQTAAGLPIDSIDSAIMNDRGQVVLTIESGTTTALIVATPIDGTPLPESTTYKMQDGYGNIVDLGWALNPQWGTGPFAFLYSFNSSVTQQVIYTADGKLRSAEDPTMFLYNDGGYLAVGKYGDTFAINQSLGAFTIKDGNLYLQSPGKVSPPNKLAFSPSPAYWSLINASPVNTTP